MFVGVVDGGSVVGVVDATIAVVLCLIVFIAATVVVDVGAAVAAIAQPVWITFQCHNFSLLLL